MDRRGKCTLHSRTRHRIGPHKHQLARLGPCLQPDDKYPVYRERGTARLKSLPRPRQEVGHDFEWFIRQSKSGQLGIRNGLTERRRIMMRRVFLLLSLWFLCWQASGQGTVLFNNNVPGIVDAPMFVNRERIRGGFTAQLYVRPLTGQEPFIPLFPTTTFKTGQEDRGFVNPVVVTAPGLPPGSEVFFLFHIFNGSTYETSDPLCRGSTTAHGVLGTGAEAPGYLLGLTSIDFDCIPEPSAWSIIVIGALCFLPALGHKRRH